MTQENHAESPTSIILVGLMLFSMFFGAGNLIFPPQLGAEAGTAYWPAILGFLTTGVLLPMVAVIAVAVSGTGLGDIAGRVGRVFGRVFTAAVYLSIGALYAIPRTAGVAFETGAAGTGATGAAARLAFTAVFFAVALWLSLRGARVVDVLGRWLTPALLALIVVLLLAALRLPAAAPGAPAGDWAQAPYPAGIVQGYLTMDSLAALVFGIVVVGALRSRGVRAGGPLTRATIAAGVLAAVLLGAVYLGLGHLGRILGPGSANGAELLGAAASRALGGVGAWIFAGIVLLACLTTAVGLITATAAWFATLPTALGYRAWAVLFTLVGLLLANQGLDTIISLAVPLNVFLHPIAVALVLITLLQAALPFRLRWAYRAPVAVAAAFAALDLLTALGADPAGALPALAGLPLYRDSLAWLAPTLAAIAICLVVDGLRREPPPRPGRAAAPGEAAAAPERAG